MAEQIFENMKVLPASLADMVMSNKICSAVGIHCLNVKGADVNWTRERRQMKVQLSMKSDGFFLKSSAWY